MLPISPFFHLSWQHQNDNERGNPFGDDDFRDQRAVDRRDIFSYRVDSGRVPVSSPAEEEDDEISGV